MANLIQRISSFKRSLGSIISCGFARAKRTNPAATLRLLTIHGTSVLMSGLGSLVHTNQEIRILDQQYKRTLQCLLKLPVSSTASLVHFVSGSLPGTAILHLRQLSLFGMISRLPGDPLHVLAYQALLTLPPTSKSWFVQVRDLHLLYQLPHPLTLLDKPLTKETHKKLVKSKVLDYWEVKLRAEAAPLTSLKYFQPEFLSLSSPHRLLTAAGSKSYEVAKARIQLLFLSARYPCGQLTRHWSPDSEGYCTFLTCQQRSTIETPEHILLECPAYTTTRLNLISMCLNAKNPVSNYIVTKLLLSTTDQIMQFLLDCSPIPIVIHTAQLHGDDIFNDLFYLSRTWCFAIHRERMKRIGRWNFK